jgi:hypothetical protein
MKLFCLGGHLWKGLDRKFNHISICFSDWHKSMLVYALVIYNWAFLTDFYILWWTILWNIAEKLHKDKWGKQMKNIGGGQILMLFNMTRKISFCDWNY